MAVRPEPRRPPIPCHPVLLLQKLDPKRKAKYVWCASISSIPDGLSPHTLATVSALAGVYDELRRPEVRELQAWVRPEEAFVNRRDDLRAQLTYEPDNVDLMWNSRSCTSSMDALRTLRRWRVRLLPSTPGTRPSATSSSAPVQSCRARPATAGAARHGQPHKPGRRPSSPRPVREFVYAVAASHTAALEKCPSSQNAENLRS